MAEFILINMGTSEVEFFADKKQAEDYAKENNFLLYNKKRDENKDNLENICFVMPCKEVKTKKSAEFTIYSNFDKSRPFGHVAEYSEDLINEDLLDTPTTAVKYTYA